jgi:beta-fructofuranosidase
MWRPRNAFWTPGLYYTHECPDLFRIGEWWYLIFSEFTDLFRTRYRMSRSLDGPWLTPKDDCFDARAFYAAKTASDGRHRYLFGWNPTRDGKRDYNTWSWGGNLVIHELNQESDGTLSVAIPQAVNDAWLKTVPMKFTDEWGHVKSEGDGLRIVATDSFGCAAAEVMPDRCRFEVKLQFQRGTRGCGVMLRASDDLEESYYVRVEPQNRRIVFDSWPRNGTPAEKGICVDGGVMPDMYRWIDFQAGEPIRIQIIVDGTIAVIYVNGRWALNTRMYDFRTGRLGIFVDQGSAIFQEMSLKTL